MMTNLTIFLDCTSSTGTSGSWTYKIQGHRCNIKNITNTALKFWFFRPIWCKNSTTVESYIQNVFSTSFIQQPKQYRSVLSYRCKLTGGERIPHNIMDRMSGVRCSKNDHIPCAPDHHWTIPVVADGHQESVISSVCKADYFMLMMIKHLEN